MKFAIMGTGVMGCGWITQCAMSGHNIHCYDSNTVSVASVAAKCKKLAAKAARKFKIDDPDFELKTMQKIKTYDWSDPGNPRPRRLSEYIIGNAEDMTDPVK